MNLKDITRRDIAESRTYNVTQISMASCKA